ncbi:HlyD family secretion protein [Piscinibacter sakaiensis]|uniref:HlyD family secretion protein n=1 Tax=Piscinibacter sakaiensis TaxID=1547922 RepID=A0A0K8P457_PISS1|nr:HlyD family efflux transporter periplasmic adaptor subunit [Piscinibacter sakaiensis]GAP36970.1 hypothetical protein ISF6_2825 [Piscinibacter sakaiensis]
MPTDDDALPLFRAEALQAQELGACGSVRLGHRPAFSVVAALALAAALAVAAYAAFGEASRRARVPGLLVPAGGQVGVAAPAAGVLRERPVAEGAVVAAGQPLFVIDTDRVTGAGEAAAERSAQLLARQRRTLVEEQAWRERLQQARRASLEARARALGAEGEQAQQEAVLADRRARLAGETARRYEGLVADGFVAEVQHQARVVEALDLEARAAAARRVLLGLARARRELDDERRSLAAVQAAEALATERALAQLDQARAENAARRRALVLAPHAGRLEAITVETGAALAAGQTLATLVPLPAQGTGGAGEGGTDRTAAGGPGPAVADVGPGRLEARLYAPGRTAGFVRPGQAVRLRYAAYPPGLYGLAQGTVRAVSAVPLAPQDLPPGQLSLLAGLASGAGTAEPLFRITVALERQSVRAHGREEPLKPGLALEADVLQERLAVWQWLFAPLLAARARAAA